MSIEARIKALERKRAAPLGRIRLYTAGGEMDLDALDALLYSIEAEAGREEAITGFKYLGGTMPRGGIWEPFYALLRETSCGGNDRVHANFNIGQRAGEEQNHYE